MSSIKICAELGEELYILSITPQVIKMNEKKELIVYSIAIGKRLYDDIDRIRNKVYNRGTNVLPFKPILDIRGCGRRFIVDIAMQCLDYLLDKGD